MKKRILPIALMLCLTLALAGCEFTWEIGEPREPQLREHSFDFSEYEIIKREPFVMNLSVFLPRPAADGQYTIVLDESLGSTVRVVTDDRFDWEAHLWSSSWLPGPCDELNEDGTFNEDFDWENFDWQGWWGQFGPEDHIYEHELHAGRVSHQFSPMVQRLFAPSIVTIYTGLPVTDVEDWQGIWEVITVD